MAPTSEIVEAFFEKVISLDATLKKLKTAEIGRPELVVQLAEIAKEWLRISTSLRNMTDGTLPPLDRYDIAMSDILSATKLRSRVTAYRTKLKVFSDDFVDTLVIPLIRLEGSPTQAAARQLEALFVGSVSSEEFAYVQEAARCSAVRCNRAAIILLWAGAIARMHIQIQRLGFAVFNQAALSAAQKKGSPYSRISKGIGVSSLAELQRLRDFDLISVGIDVWSYDLQAFEELDRLLSTRNSAAHPGMYSPTALDLRQFGEKVKRYVFDSIK
jgi:hypothetical protein